MARNFGDYDCSKDQVEKACNSKPFNKNIVCVSLFWERENKYELEECLQLAIFPWISLTFHRNPICLVDDKGSRCQLV